jgi:hypothetical protein
MVHGGEWNGEGSGVLDSRSAEGAREARRCMGANACARASEGALARRKWAQLDPGADARVPSKLAACGCDANL